MRSISQPPSCACMKSASATLETELRVSNAIISLSRSTTLCILDRLLRLAQNLEDLFQLRADRQVECLAGRQAAQEPLVVELGEPPLARHAREGALDHRGEGRIVAPEHEPVGIVGEILADDFHVGGA